MAIDTAAKRLSATNLLLWNRSIFPDGTIAQNDRQATTLIYSGILSTTPTIPSGGWHGNDFIAMWRKRKHR